MKFTINRIKQLNTIQNGSIIITDSIIYMKTFINDEHILFSITNTDQSIIKDSEKTKFIEKLVSLFEYKNFEIFHDNYQLDFIRNYDVEDNFDNFKIGDIICFSIIKQWFLIGKMDNKYVLFCLGETYSDMVFDSIDELKKQIQKSVYILDLKYYARNNVELVIDLID